MGMDKAILADQDAVATAAATGVAAAIGSGDSMGGRRTVDGSRIDLRSARVALVFGVALGVLLGLIATAYAVADESDPAEVRRSTAPPFSTGSVRASSPRPSCFGGKVWLGSRVGAIDFQARCRPTSHSGEISIELSRVTPEESAFVPIRAFRRVLLVKGAPGVRRGRCVRANRTNGEILCSARVEGSAVLEGRIWVVAEGRCDSNIQLVSHPSVEPCRGVCSPVLPGSTLIASGKPRAC
jgi:hypothetical protein